MTDYTFKSNFTTKIDFRQAKTPKTNSLTVVYIHGLYSDCWGRKPENVMEWCAANGVNFFRFELAGHGSDSARYEETDVNIWKAQLLEVIDFLFRIIFNMAEGGRTMETLRNAKVGQTVKVVKLHGEGAVKRRLMDMGLTRGTEVYIRKVAPLGDPVEVTVRNYELSIRKADAEMIEIEAE